MASKIKQGSPQKGTRGPPKTPTAILKKSGAGNDKRRAKQFEEPIPVMGMPLIPLDVQYLMDDKAREHWEAVSVVLDRMGVLGDVDAHVIARYCIIFSKWCECEEHRVLNGLTYVHVNQGGERTYRPHPEAAMAVKYSEELLKIEREFGMTSSARAAVDVNKQRDRSVSTAGKYLEQNG